MSFEEFEEFITTKQDELTDLLLQLHKEEGGGKFVRAFLRRAVINYIEEVPVPGRHKKLQRIHLLNQLAEAITIPCHQHHTL
jgi:hypothetical protein